jgi:hypothetical protein
MCSGKPRIQFIILSSTLLLIILSSTLLSIILSSTLRVLSYPIWHSFAAQLRGTASRHSFAVLLGRARFARAPIQVDLTECLLSDVPNKRSLFFL